MNFNQQELTDIYRWAEHEERTASFQSNVDRARRIKAKVSQALAMTPSAMPQASATQPTKSPQPS